MTVCVCFCVYVFWEGGGEGVTILFKLPAIHFEHTQAKSCQFHCKWSPFIRHFIAHLVYSSVKSSFHSLCIASKYMNFSAASKPTAPSQIKPQSVLSWQPENVTKESSLFGICGTHYAIPLTWEMIHLWRPLFEKEKKNPFNIVYIFLCK